MSSTVFLGYDRAALDREYDNRAKVPHFAEYLARWQRQSEAVRRELPCRLDLAYGPSPGERLDVFLPSEGRAPAPIQVFVHGGYWQRLDKADTSYVARAFHPAGAATVVINYALIPTVDMDELVRQCRAAVAWVHRHAASFGGDPGRLFVSGHSAGGHLVAMLLATDWPAFAGLPADAVKGGAGISGLYDLEPIRLCFLNEVLGLTPEQARRNSPVHHVPDRAAPLLLAVGGLEGDEYHRQTADMAAAWRRRGLPAEVLPFSGHDHFSIAAQLDDPSSELARAIRRQMGLP
jgi:arylformamidase